MIKFRESIKYIFIFNDDIITADKYSSSSLRTMGLHEIYHSKLGKFHQYITSFVSLFLVSFGLSVSIGLLRKFFGHFWYSLEEVRN